MDNLSHSVAGLAVGELIHRSLPSEADSDHQRTRRRLLLVSGWLASNFPDLDLVLTPLLPEPLGYLLHHRGHTHTLLYAIPQALLLWLLLWLLWPSARRLLHTSSTARRGLVLTLATGFVLHMAMDYLNSYGIHPFHPFDSHWHYGDMVFILEPVFWVLFGVPMIMTVQRVWLRGLLLALLIGVPLFFTTRGFLPWTSLAALGALALLMGWAQHRTHVRSIRAFLLAFGIAIGFVGMQGMASKLAREVVVNDARSKDPASRVVDAAMTSFPTNPFCWTFVSVEADEGADRFRLRRGVVSAVPQIMPVNACPPALWDRPPEQTAPVALVVFMQEQGALSALRQRQQENCHFDAWLRFARMPVVDAHSASDIRFASSPRGNFTTMRFADFANRECARTIPRWEYPRADLLAPVHRPAD